MSGADMVEMTISNGTICIIGADIVQTRNKLEKEADKAWRELVDISKYFGVPLEEKKKEEEMGREERMDWRELVDMVSKWQEDATKLKMIEEVLRNEDYDNYKVKMISRIVGIKNKEK